MTRGSTRRAALLATAAVLGVPRLARAQAGDGRGELRIGALFPFSGPLGLLGDESFRGLELAVEERNASGGLGGRMLRLVKGDATDAGAAVAELRRLVGAERAALVFGTFSTSLSLAASQANEMGGTPYFELGAIGDAVTERGLRHLFRTCPRATEFGRLGVDSLIGTVAPLLGTRAEALRVAILHEDGAYGEAIAAAQAQRMQERGLAPAERLSYPVRSGDLGGAVGRLRSVAADILLHTGYGNDIQLLFRTMREANWRPRMVMGAGAGYSLSDTARAIGRGFEGVMNVDFTQYEVNERAAPGARAVAEAYKRAYGADPRSGHSLVNYAGARMCLDAVARAGATERDRVRAAMLALDLPEGGTPAGWGARFDERGQNTRARPWLLQWQEGRLVTIGPEEGAVAAPRGRMEPA